MLLRNFVTSGLGLGRACKANSKRARRGHEPTEDIVLAQHRASCSQGQQRYCVDNTRDAYLSDSVQCLDVRLHERGHQLLESNSFAGDMTIAYFELMSTIDNEETVSDHRPLEAQASVAAV